MSHRTVPELLAPAGSLDAVRAAVANGADAVYVGAERFNARDDGAQLTLAELGEACRVAHGSGRRVYLTLNVLVKPAELRDALLFLGDAVDRGIDAVIVQDIGLVRLIRTIYPSLEIHGSTQMTVHDAAGARLMYELGVERVVLARENTIDDIRAIRATVPELGLETFVHGALCISYSGQCYMSGMISERSANRGSCAQSCRKEYTLTDAATGATLDEGYLISAKDLAAYDHLAEIAAAGVGCLKVEGRKKKPEYVATVTHGYREFLDRLAAGEPVAASPADVQPLVQIFSRGFTGGMYGGRAGRDYITRTHPDNHGAKLGTVVGRSGLDLIVDVAAQIAIGDGLAFEPPEGEQRADTIGFSVTAVHTLRQHDGSYRLAIAARRAVPVGWRVLRTADSTLLQNARQSFADVPLSIGEPHVQIDVRLFGNAGSPLKALFTAEGETVAVTSEVTLAPAARRSLTQERLRDQLGRLGGTPFALATLDDAGLTPGLFLPLSELNHLRQRAVEELSARRDLANDATLADRRSSVDQAVNGVAIGAAASWTANAADDSLVLAAEVYRVEDARAAAQAGATEIVFDPFLRHPVPPVARVAALALELATLGVKLRVRTPTIVRPEERRSLDRWLDRGTGFAFLSGHAGLVAELGAAGRDVVADYAVNCFNEHTAAEFFRLGASRITLSVELTAAEMREVALPWLGRGFDVVIYGRPEGMTLEHCVLSAAFDREVTTCRDLCVKKHPLVELTDPAGYTFSVATDSACRNRLLHSRPIEGSEYLKRLWGGGFRGFRLLLNVPDLPVTELVHGYRSQLERLARGESGGESPVRELVGGAFTRGHFARAV